eukprot:bmy_20560T0
MQGCARARCPASPGQPSDALYPPRPAGTWRPASPFLQFLRSSHSGFTLGFLQFAPGREQPRFFLVVEQPETSRRSPNSRNRASNVGGHVGLHTCPSLLVMNRERLPWSAGFRPVVVLKGCDGVRGPEVTWPVRV